MGVSFDLKISSYPILLFIICLTPPKLEVTGTEREEEDIH
jgi:hypothetical protein